VGTPVIIEKLLRDSTGVPFHCFSFYCPGCGRRLSRFQPVPIWALRDITKEVVRAKVVFIDRVSPSAFVLAKNARDAGALVFFEPSTSTSDRELRRILPFTHIFKYSHERMHETLDVLPESVLLEVQTLGRGGLRFRMRSGQTRRLKRWAHINSYPVENMVDSSGAGDWFSAALIHLLFRGGERAARAMGEAGVMQALSKAQKLAAWSCNFIGARGAMYYAPLVNIEKVLASAEIQLPRSGDPVADLCDSNLLCETCASDKEDTHSFPVRRSIFPRPQ
jgi:fructokinase